MWKKFFVGAVLFVGSAGFAMGTGIPVIDIANLAQALQQVMAWKQQLTQMQSQISQLQSTYNSLNGTRNLGMILNNPALLNSLPPQWTQVYSQIQQGGLKGLTGSGLSIRNANMIYNCQGKAGTDLALCQRDLNKTAQDKGFGMDAYAVAQGRLTNIQNLMGQINSTSDPKSIAELGARMQAEQAMIQNEQTKLQLFKMMADAEEKLIQQQKAETSMKDMQNTSKARDGSLQPVQF